MCLSFLIWSLITDAYKSIKNVRNYNKNGILFICLKFFLFLIGVLMRGLYKTLMVFDDSLKVSMVLVGYNRHEPNMLRSFWELSLAGTIKKPPPNVQPVRLFLY